MDGIQRRQLLVAGGTALSVGLAGCLWDGESGDEDDWTPPAYTGYLGDPEGELIFGMIRPSGLGVLIDLLEGENVEERFPDDDILRDPIRQLSIFWATQQISLYTIGLDTLLDPDGPPTASDVEWVLTSSQGIVLYGSIDGEEADEILTTVGETDSEFAEPVRYEQAGSRDECTLYEPQDTGEGTDTGGQIAVSDEAIILSGESGTALDVAVGDQPRVYEEFDVFQWLVRSAGQGSVVFGRYEPVDTEESDSEDSTMGASLFGSTQAIHSITFESGTISLDMAVSFGELSDAERAAYRSELEQELESGEAEDVGPQADERSIDVSDRGVEISLTYDESLAASPGG